MITASVVTAALSAMLLAACASGAGRPGTGTTGPAATTGHTPARPASATTSSAAPGETVLDCDSLIGRSARNCASAGGGWLAYAGGYWIDHPACVSIIVRAGARQQQVDIGVGTACPGQRPPAEPSQG